MLYMTLVPFCPTHSMLSFPLVAHHLSTKTQNYAPELFQGSSLAAHENETSIYIKTISTQNFFFM